MNVAKNNPLLATAASLSPKNTSATASSSGDFSAALSKLFSSHSSTSQNSSKSDAGSGYSSRHSHSQDQDASTGSSAHTSGHADAKSNQDLTPQQQPAVTLSMLAKPTSIVFGSQQPAEATSVSTTATADLTAPTDLSSLANNKSTQVAGQQGATLTAIQSGMSQAGTVQAGTTQPTTFAQVGTSNNFLAPEDTSLNAIPTAGDAAPGSNSTTSTASLDSATGDAASIAPVSGNSNTLYGPSQIDSDTDDSTQPSLPITFGYGTNDQSTFVPDSTAPVTALPSFTATSDVTEAGALAESPVSSGLAPATAAGVLTASPSLTSVAPVTVSAALADSPSLTGLAPVTATGAPAGTAQPTQPGHIGFTPVAPVKATVATDGHNQIATAHRPITTTPAPTTSVSTSQPTSDPLLRTGTINNGLLHELTGKPTGPGHLDDQAVSVPTNQPASQQASSDGVATTPFAINGTASMDNSASSSDDSGSADSKDRTKDDAVFAVTANTVQAPVMQIMSATAQLQAAPSIQTTQTDVSGPSNSHLPGSTAAKSSDLEAASVSDSKSVINTSKLMQTFNQSEMRVGMRSAEFGDISIRAQATHDSILTQISVDHPELASSLATHVPDMQARLASHGNVEVQISNTQSHSGSSSTSSDGGSGYQGGGSQNSSRQQDQSGSNSYFSSSYGNASYGNSALPTAAIANTLQNAGYDGRLDLQA